MIDEDAEAEEELVADTFPDPFPDDELDEELDEDEVVSVFVIWIVNSRFISFRSENCRSPRSP